MTPSDSSAGNATRRKVLGWGGVGAIGGLAAYFGWARNSESPRATTMPAKPATVASAASPATPQVNEAPAAESVATVFNREAFLPHLNSDFTLVQEGVDSGTCRLVEVGPASRISSPKQTYVCFTLMFEADFFFLREGGICKVKHAQMPEMQFFLSPVGNPGGRKMLLEAAFTQAI